jgi:hypothetical protein
MKDDSSKMPEPGTGPTLQSSPELARLFGMQAATTTALSEILRDTDTAACYLEQIARHACDALNEAHWQTELQRGMRDDLEAVREILESAYPSAALDLRRRDEERQRLDECCPPPPPIPICEPQPCPPEPESGEHTTGRGEAPGVKVEGAPYPPFEITGEAAEGRNADHYPFVPPGPLRGSLAPEVPAQEVLDYRGGTGGAANPVQFVVDTGVDSKVPISGFPPDMSGAVGNGVVMMSGNTSAAYSTDGGIKFTTLNPTKIFPSTATKDAAGNLLDNGLCCDQVIQYVPSIDRFIWLMQFCGSGAATGGTCLQGVNRIRIAAASPTDIKNSKGTAWTYWDLTSAGLKLGNRSMDYPDMSVGTNSLYVSADSVGSGGLVVVRIPLAQIQAGGSISFDFTDPSTPSGQGAAYGSHLCQNVGDTVYWAGHFNTSKLRVFSMKEGENRYSWRDVDHDSYPSTDFTSLCPDNNDWLNFVGTQFGAAAVIGATLVGSEVWFAWIAARGGGFAQPHVQVLQIDINTFKKTKQWQIWNSDYAFAYPSLATNAAGEVGIALAWGGNKKYFASFAVGILGDFVVWYSEASDATDATNSGAGSNTRWGDYLTCRRAHPDGNLYGGFGYAALKNAPPAAGTRFNPRYILFGRQSDVPQRGPR